MSTCYTSALQITLSYDKNCLLTTLLFRILYSSLPGFLQACCSTLCAALYNNTQYLHSTVLPTTVRSTYQCTLCNFVGTENSTVYCIALQYTTKIFNNWFSIYLAVISSLVSTVSLQLLSVVSPSSTVLSLQYNSLFL